MAIYHLNAKTLGRSQGRSATGAAAYRAAARIAHRWIEWQSQLEPFGAFDMGAIPPCVAAQAIGQRGVRALVQHRADGLRRCFLLGADQRVLNRAIGHGAFCHFFGFGS